MPDPRLETAVRFSRAFDEEILVDGTAPPDVESAPPSEDTDGFAAKLLAQRWILGPLSVERARRTPSATFTSFADRLADRAVAKRSARADGALTVEPCARSKSLGPCVAAALRAHASRVTLQVGLEAPFARLREVCAPLLDDGLTTVEVEAPRRTASVVVAPFYYAPFDLRRLADQLALERLHPSPLADGGLQLVLAARWDQRRRLLELVEERVGAREATRMETRAIEADEIPDLLDGVAPESFASAFVYPMWLERVDVRAATSALAARAKGFVLNARPSIAFWLGGESAACFEVPQLLRPAPSLAWCRRRALYERGPTLSAALKSAVEGWVPSLVMR